MPHQRQLIRDAAVAALLSQTSAGARVKKTRMEPHRTSELPAISVYTDEETVDDRSGNTSPRVLRREMQLAIEGWAMAAEDVDDALDTLAQEIERAIHADETLDGTCMDCLLASTQLGVKLDGQRPMGAVRLVYSVIYETLAPDPDDAPAGTLEDLSTVTINYDANGSVITADEAVDSLENLED